MLYKTQHATRLQHRCVLGTQTRIAAVNGLLIGQGCACSHSGMVLGQLVGNMDSWSRIGCHVWCQKGVPKTGVLGCALSCDCMAPDRKAALPASTALANARAITTGP